MILSRAQISLEDGWASVPGPGDVSFTEGATLGPWEPGVPYRQQQKIRPTEAQWVEFLRMCDAIDIWSLEHQVKELRLSNYGDSNEEGFVFDCLHFQLDLRARDRAVTVKGPIMDVPPGGEEKLWFIYCELLVMAGWELPETLVSRRYVPANLTPQKSE